MPRGPYASCRKTSSYVVCHVVCYVVVDVGSLLVGSYWPRRFASAQSTAARAFEGSTYRDRVVRVRRALSTEELARVVDVQPRQVQHWVAGDHRPQGRARERLLDLDYVVELLGDVYDDEGVQIWLHGRNRSLGGRRPLELLIKGDFPTVLAAVERLASGAM